MKTVAIVLLGLTALVLNYHVLILDSEVQQIIHYLEIHQ